MKVEVFTGLDPTNQAMVLLDSLRVNLDMGKAAYGWMMMRDENIPGTVVRTSTIPEELGRLVYLLTDKTGTTCMCLPGVARVRGRRVWACSSIGRYLEFLCCALENWHTTRLHFVNCTISSEVAKY